MDEKEEVQESVTVATGAVPDKQDGKCPTCGRDKVNN